VAEDGYDEAEPTSSLPAPVREVLDQIGDDLALLLTVTIPPLERARRLAVALEQETAEAARVIQALLNHSSITTTSWVQDTTAVMDAQNWLDQYQRG
jgi:hypothetical protein